MMKNVLITGVAGFLGSHLAMHHLSRGDNVIGVDNFSSSRPTSHHLRMLKESKAFTFYNIDICNEQELSSVVEMGLRKYEKKLNITYNFACPASPPRYQAIPIETMMTCVVGTKNVIDITRRFGEQDVRVVHASTSEIYGNPYDSPQVETDWGNVNSYGFRSCYDEGKRAAEALCFDYLHKFDTDIRIVRIFNTYGPHLDPSDGRVISNFLIQAASGQPITVYGDGCQTRSFCYVDDLIRGIVSMGELKTSPRVPINLGNPDEFTINELVETIIELYPGACIEFNPLPQDDPMRRKPNIDRAKEILKWNPEIDLRTGLIKTARYWEEIRVISHIIGFSPGR